ncbi:methyltransferase domain-containing protein [Limibaculum sp. M0105]|uniref:Methyltransferase domain-containing protein n=1 Tax=Thermohalobaculum xanthum TaxID=2753746 RepID=A0A8J7M9P5_9RHOB|nr:methyltransferase domain-containing protein [Thermohalobaculum xanthum]MBK0400350.1 methyltransferase domain-containing protein [Thermohalobaculum xanthum]
MTDDDTPLARAYNRALRLEKAGRHDEAAAAYREVLALDPADHGGAAVRLAAMARGEAPDGAPPAYVATLFDQQAEAFEGILVDRLGYGVPGLIAARLAGRRFARVLDLGCGTGLVAEALAEGLPESVGYIAGVDLSEGMLGVADDKGLYDDLYLGDVAEFLAAEDAEDGAPFDLIVAADVLPYLGGVEALFEGAAQNLEPGGLLVFSTETLAAASFGGRPWKVGPRHRYAHDLAYLQAALAAAGFAVDEAEPITVRFEEGAPVPGHLMVAHLAG